MNDPQLASILLAAAALARAQDDPTREKLENAFNLVGYCAKHFKMAPSCLRENINYIGQIDTTLSEGFYLPEADFDKELEKLNENR